MDTMPPSTHGFLVSSVEERDAGEGLGLHAGKIDILSHQNLILIFEEAGTVSPRLLLPTPPHLRARLRVACATPGSRRVERATPTCSVCAASPRVYTSRNLA